MGRVLFVIAVSEVALLAAGCQTHAKITWDPPKTASVEKRTGLAVGDLSQLNRKWELWEGKPGSKATIGKHTLTVFALPIANISANDDTPVKESFDKAVRVALAAAGYDLVESSQSPGNSPVLRGEVNRCWWWSYTWLWPLTVQGGQNEVTLYLETRDGKLLWKRTFARSEPGFAFVGSYGFDLMIKWSMTKLVRDISQACSSEPFKSALATN
jgi:hypothetical protein